MIKLGTPLNQVDTTAQFTEGTQTMVRDPVFDSLNIYEYRAGHSTSATGSIYEVVTWTSTGSTSLLTTSTRGQAGIAMGTLTSATYGWYLVKGTGWALCGARASSGTALYASGTTGCVTHLATLGALIVGAFAAGTGVPSSGGTVKVYLNFPSVTGAI